MRHGGVNLVGKTYLHLVVFSWFVFALQWCFSFKQSEFNLTAYEEPQVQNLLSFLSRCPIEKPMVQSVMAYRGQRTSKSQEIPKWQDSLPFNLNTMDSASLERLPWIGPVSAGRICRFREALGGFHTAEQLAEVWGMNSDQIKVITPWFHVGNGPFRFICIDTASWSTMKAHPYIRSTGARYIERYRNQHALSSIHDLKNAIPVNDSLFRRWLPYLRLCNVGPSHSNGKD